MQLTWTPATRASVPEQGHRQISTNLLSMRCPHILKRLGIRHQVESGEPFTADQNLRKDIAVRRGGLRGAPNKGGYRETSILLDVTHADPQAHTHLRGGSALWSESGDACSLNRTQGLDIGGHGRTCVRGQIFIQRMQTTITGLASGHGK